MKKLLAGTALCLSLSGHAALAQQFSNLVIFGDSLSDTGNLAKIVPPAILSTMPPGIPPYYNDRFSNGPIYADTLGGKLGSSAPTADFAYGGAYTAKLNETVGAVPISGVNIVAPLNGLDTVSAVNPVAIDTSVQGQIASYLGSGASVNHNGLYVVWGGANDYFAMAGAIQAQPTLTTTQIQGIIAQQVKTTVGNLAADITLLARAGAHSFVVPTLPNLGGTPNFNGAASSAQLGQLTSFAHDSALAATMGTLGQQLHANIYLIDTAGLFSDIQANPGKYGVSNVTQACLTSAGICANPGSYLFWDSVHPTTGIQQLFSQAVAATVTAPLVIGAQGKMADIATQQIFDSVSSRVNALQQGAEGFTLSGPGGASSHVDTDNPVSFYVSGSYGQGSRDDQATQAGFDYSHGSVQGGADVRVGDNAAVGVQVGFGDTSATLKDGMGDDDLKSYSVSLYAGLFGEHWYGSGAVFYAYQDWSKLNRNTNVAGQVAAGTSSGTDVGAKLEGGYMWRSGGFAFGPTAELRYARINIDAYTESGAVALNQEVDNQHFSTIITQIGGQVSTAYDSDGMVWKPSLRIGWDHQFEPATRDVFSRLASLPQATIDTTLVRSAHDWARIGAGLNVQASRFLTVIGDVDGSVGRADGQDVSGMVRLVCQF